MHKSKKSQKDQLGLGDELLGTRLGPYAEEIRY